MRRRLMGGVSIKATLVSQMDAIAGDVCFYNSETDSKEFYRLDAGDEQIPPTCTPIGVVVIPASHDVYGNGDCGVMSINPMNYNTPISGGSSEQNIYWGQYGTDTGLPNLNKVNQCGVVSAQTNSVTTTSSAYLPSNKISGGTFNEADTANTCIHDTDTHYYSSGSTTCAPSPYLSDDSRNPMYYTTSASTANCLSDFDGVGNTNTLVSLHTIDDLSTATTVTNDTGSTAAPAAACCHLYKTKGTNQGNWYLPAMGELGYIMPKWNEIQGAISNINTVYGSNVVAVSLNDSNYYRSSSEYSSGGARYLYTANGDVGGYNKNGNGYVRAFLRVPPPIKYGPIQLTGGSIDDIPASGGTSGAPTGYTYTQTWGHGGSSTNGGIITSGAEISYTTVTAGSLGTTITNRAKVGDSVLTITMNGVTNEFNIPVYQSQNQVTQIESKINSFTYSGQVSASGGTASPTVNDSYTVYYSSGSSSTSAPSSGTVNRNVIYSGSAEGASLNTSTGVITWGSRETTIGNVRNINVEVSTQYTYSHDNSIIPGALIVATNTAKSSKSHSQAANLITKVEANSNTFSYSNINAGSTSASPSTSHSPKYTFSSGSTSTTTPDTSYGSLTTSVTYTMANNTTNGFTACNSSTGVLTATNRGTTIGNARTSANVVKSLTYTWKHSSTYGSGSVGSGNITKSATCTQEGNYVTDITSTAASLSYPNISASATSASPSYDFGDVQYTFSSGSKSTTNPGTTYGTYSGTLKYSLATSQNGFTSVNTTSGVLIATNRSTTIGNARASATVTCTLSMSWTPTSTYNAAGTKTVTRTATATCTQNGNYVTAVTPSANTGYSSHFTYDSNVGAGGGTISPTGRGQATYTFSSGATTTSGSASWTNAGTTTFSRTYSGTLATGFTSINSSSGAVTASSRGTTQGNARGQTVSSTLTVTFTHNSTYSAGGTKSGTLTQSATCTQSANNSSMTSVRIVAHQPDNTWLATSSWGSIPAGGHYLGVYGYYGYTWSSGSTSETAVGNLKTGLTYTTSMAEVHTNGGLHVLSRGTSYNASTRSGTVYWTYNGLKSNTLSFTQNANTISITSVTSSPGSLTGATFNAGGQTKDITATAASASAVLTYSSGSTVTTNYNATDYGTWTFHGYTGSSNQTYAVVNSTNYNKMSISMGNNTSTAARSAIITRKEAGFTFTLNSTYGGANKRSTGTQCTCTVTQSAGAKQYGSWTGGAVTFNSTSALSAGADSRTVTIAPWTRTWGWNSTSGGGTQTYTGSVTLSENGSYTSLNVSSYTASGSNKTATLTKSTCGTTTVAATTVTVTAKGATTTTGSLSQNANGISSYGAVSVTSHGSASDIPASGGTIKASGGSGKQTITYTSGSTRAGSVSCGGYSGVSANSLGTTTKSRTYIGNSTATLTGEGSKTATVSVAVYQQANTRSATSTSGGVTTYSNVTAGTIANKTIPASGGSATATAGNGSQTWSKSAVVTTYTYTSGSTKNETTTAASSGTNTISPSASSYTASANSKGTTVSAQTTVGSKAVTWSGSGGKSASGTMYIYQAANAKTSITYGTPTLSLSYSGTVPASGGSKAPTYSYSQSRTQNYTSGSTSTLSNITSGGTLSFSGSATGATVNSSTGVVSWSPNTSTSARSCTVTLKVTLNGKSGSKAATCTQSGYVSTTSTLTISADKMGGLSDWWADTYQTVSGDRATKVYTISRNKTHGPLTIGLTFNYDSYATQYLWFYTENVTVSGDGQEFNAPGDSGYATINWDPADGNGHVSFYCE